VPETTLKLLLVDDNPGDARLVREMLSEAEGVAFDTHWAESLLDALEALAHSQFDIILTDLSLPDSQGLDAFHALKSHAPSVPIVVLTGLEDDRAAAEAVRSGAQDFLSKGKLKAQSLARVLRFAVMRQSTTKHESGPQARKATVFGMLSAKGGVGTTTVASHFALELKRQTGQKVLLVDLDPCSAAASLLFHISSPHTILDAARNLQKLDESLWNGVVVHAPEGIDVIQSPGAVRLGDEISGERVRHVLRFVRPLYGSIVVDLGQLNAVSMPLIPEMSEIFMVSLSELTSLYDAGRALKRLLDLGFEATRVRLVLNRVSKAVTLSVPDVEKALGYPVHSTIQDSSEELASAYSEGHFLDPGLNIRKQVAQLAARSLGLEIEPVQTGFKRLLFGRPQPRRNELQPGVAARPRESWSGQPV